MFSGWKYNCRPSTSITGRIKSGPGACAETNSSSQKKDIPFCLCGVSVPPIYTPCTGKTYWYRDKYANYQLISLENSNVFNTHFQNILNRSNFFKIKQRVIIWTTYISKIQCTYIEVYECGWMAEDYVLSMFSRIMRIEKYCWPTCIGYLSLQSLIG